VGRRKARRRKKRPAYPAGRVHQAGAVEGLLALPAGSVQCIVTSPPYWGLRDYGVEGQWGMEKTPQEYVGHMREFGRAAAHALRDDGTLWLNMGDCYASGEVGRHDGRTPGHTYGATHPGPRQHAHLETGLKPKDLVLMPARVALALQADGWWLRQDIIWSKPNPMPESTRDRPTTSHEHVFLLTKSARYFYDADAVREITGHEATWEQWRKADGRNAPSGTLSEGINCGFGSKKDSFTHPAGRNLRSVWTIPTQPYPGAHFATFPGKLVEPCVKAGTSEHGACPSCGAPWARVVERTSMKIDRSERAGAVGRTQTSGTMTEPPTARTIGWRPTCKCAREDTVPCLVCDPFAGSGTSGEAAVLLGRAFVGFDLAGGDKDLGGHTANGRIARGVNKRKRLALETRRGEAPKTLLRRRRRI